MFHLRRNDMRIRASICEEHPFESVIVGFTSTASEYDFVSFAAQQPSNLQSSFLDRISRRFSGPVIARWIAVWFFEDTPHCSDYFWRNGRAGIEIEVDASSSYWHPSWTSRTAFGATVGPRWCALLVGVPHIDRLGVTFDIEMLHLTG
jgi:hypothetical protein